MDPRCTIDHGRTCGKPVQEEMFCVNMFCAYCDAPMAWACSTFDDFCKKLLPRKSKAWSSPSILNLGEDTGERWRLQEKEVICDILGLGEDTGGAR